MTGHIRRFYGHDESKNCRSSSRGCEMRALEGFNTRSRYRTAGAVVALVFCVVGVAGCDRTSGGSGSPTSSVTGSVPRPSSEPEAPTVHPTTWSEITTYIEPTPYVVPTRTYGSKPTPGVTTPAPTTTQLPTLPESSVVPPTGGTGDDVPPDEDVPVPDE